MLTTGIDKRGEDQGLEDVLEAFRVRLTLSDSEKDRVLSDADDLVADLRDIWPVKRAMAIGAIARGTAPAPISGASVALVIQPGPKGDSYRLSSGGAKAAVEDLEVALSALKGPEHTRRGRSSIIIGSGAYPIRVLPVFEDADGGVFLADGDGETWRPCHLSRQLAYLLAEDKRLQGRARGILILLNAWQRHHRLALHSYHLETMALNAMATPPSGLASGLFHALQKLPRAIQEPCPDPTQDGVFLDAYLAGRQDKRDEIAHVAFMAAKSMGHAIDLDMPGTTRLWAKSLAKDVLGMGPSKPLIPPHAA